MSEPSISAVCLLGQRGERLPRLCSALAAQTAAAELEVVFVGGGEDALECLPQHLRSIRVPWSPGLSFGSARAEGARRASGEIVAFLLDHCYPEPAWAEALMDAYDGNAWAQVGYGVRNANPGSYASRAVFLANYGPWQGAEAGGISLLPGNNVSYRRRELVALGDELDELLEIDASVNRRLVGSGLTVALEPGAAVASECFDSVLDACRANETYGRLLATHRARIERWSLGRRVLHGLAAPLLATAFRVARIWQGSEDRRGELLFCLPAVGAICIGWGLGESRGYLLGEGEAPRRLIHWELDAIRAGA